ncbi:hypothetical protein M405DRAFT_96943 [Rhizopogon salebrosus TDB-379]|nr:hypothetical protein M405DRAFT_96943 [Rhizopogon salebrosus TDB-379]
MRATAVVRWRDLRSTRAIPVLQILYPASSAWLQLRFVLLLLLGPGVDLHVARGQASSTSCARLPSRSGAPVPQLLAS